MRLIHTTASLRSTAGGPSRSITGLCSALAALGHETHIVTSDLPADNIIRPSHPGVTIHFASPHEGKLKRQLAFGSRIEDLIRQSPSTAIHDHGLWLYANYSSHRVARRLNVPYISHPRGMLEPWARAHHRFRKTLAWLIYQGSITKNASCLIATSRQECATIRQACPHTPIGILPNGVPDSMLIHAPRQEEAHPRHFLALSRLHPVKNLGGLIHAMAISAQTARKLGWALRIVGPDEDGHLVTLQTQVRKLGIEDIVAFSPECNEQEKLHILRSATVLVLASFSENFSVTVAEALAQGIPVIASHGTPWQCLVDSDCGLHVPTTPEALAAAMTHMMNLHPDHRNAMGWRGAQLARNNFTWSAIGRQAETLYRTVHAKHLALYQG